MSFESLAKTIRNVVTIDRATSTYSSGLRIGQTVHLSDPDADRLLRVTGFSGPGSEGRWTDGATASIDLKLAPESVGICRLRLQLMPFVTQTEGQTLRLRCGKGEERVEHFPPGAFAWTTVDLPLGDVRADALARIHIKVDHTFVPAKLGLSSDARALGVLIRQIELLANRRLGIQLHRLEFVRGFSRFRSTARWALRSLLNAPHRIVWRLREFLNRPVVERLRQVEDEIRKHGGTFRAVTSDSLVREHPPEGLAKQATQVGAVVRAIEETTGPRLVAIEQLLTRLEQRIAAVNEKTDVVLNRTSRLPLLSPLEANVLPLPAVVVIGAGGHAKVVVELIRAQGRYDVVGCTDPAPERGDVVGAPILGGDDILPDLYAQGVRHCFVALGDNPLRMKVARRVTSLGFELINAISPNAIVSPTARLGHGVAVMAGAVINAATVVEDLAIINTRSVVDHDCQIGEAAHVAPRAALAGGVRIGPLAFVGAGATIVPGISVGESSIIGAGATVISNLGPNLVAVGVPARPVQRPSGKQKVDHGKS